MAKKKKATAEEKSGRGRPKKEGLRKPQFRILRALVNAGGEALDRKTIGERAEVDVPMMNSYIGSHDEEARKKNDENVCVSLLTLGYVKYGPKEEGSRGATYQVSAAGKKAYEKVKADFEAKEADSDKPTKKTKATKEKAKPTKKKTAKKTAPKKKAAKKSSKKKTKKKAETSDEPTTLPISEAGN